MQPIRQKIVFLSGAGISAESGMPTFRDKGGLWSQIDFKRFASAAGFYENPKLVLDFYNQRRTALAKAKQNHAHILIAQFLFCGFGVDDDDFERFCIAQVQTCQEKFFILGIEI